MKLKTLIGKIKDPNQYESRKETLELVHACEKMLEVLISIAAEHVDLDEIPPHRHFECLKTDTLLAREVLKELI